MAVIGLPYLPPGEFVHWLKDNLLMAEACLQIRIELTSLLYAEAWPAAWKVALKWWGSKLLSEPELLPLTRDTTFFDPPIKTFLKTGSTGITLLKKVAALRLSGHEQREKKDASFRRFLQWRPSVIPLFIGAGEALR